MTHDIEAAAQPLRGARVAFTAKLAMTRRAAEAAVVAAGGTPVTHVSRRTTVLVVGMQGWPLLPDGSVSSKLKRAEALNGGGAAIEIVSERRFRDLAGLEPPRLRPDKQYSPEQVCRLLDIAPQTLRRWELLSLVQSCAERYDYADIVSLQTIAELVNRGVKPEVISRSLGSLRAVLPGSDRPLSQLRIVMENRDTLLAEIGRVRMSCDGQLTLMFEDGAPQADPPITLSPQPTDAAAWFERGRQHEDQESFEQAEDAYRRAIAGDPALAEAYFNLGNVLRARGNPQAAAELYRTALAHQPALACAHYNLADILEEQGDLDQAIGHLRAALDIDPNYADAHYNLANCYEQAALATKARTHWAAYLALDPDSTWATVARQRLNVLAHS